MPSVSDSTIESDLDAMHKLLQRKDNKREIQQTIQPTRRLKRELHKIMEPSLPIQRRV